MLKQLEENKMCNAGITRLSKKFQHIASGVMGASLTIYSNDTLTASYTERDVVKILVNVYLNNRCILNITSETMNETDIGPELRQDTELCSYMQNSYAEDMILEIYAKVQELDINIEVKHGTIV
jgi:hypothetical protein